MDYKDIKRLFLRFWRSEDEKISLLRDILIAFLAVFIILMILWSYTGHWFGTPMVAIESGSMMHPDEPFGRLGTIDPGDMVLLVKTETRDDIVPFGGDYEGPYSTKDPDKFFYGNYGDVIVYKKYGREDVTQIIHRAMAWVDVHINGSEKTYTIKDWGIYNEETLYIPEIGLRSASGGEVSPDWSHSGYLTKGDNPDTNPTCDQLGGICREPIKLEWISGKARSELPWIGTINLLFSDITNGHFWDDNNEITVYNVQPDSIVCLIILIGVLLSIPIILDFLDYLRDKNKKHK